jgi:hypothetical protein
MEKSNGRGIAAKERKERKRNYYFRPGTPEGIRVREIGTAPGDCTNLGLMPVGTSVAPIYQSNRFFGNGFRIDG